jgi:alkylation response protein AidB-like acyl-CoA dehydrogenase
MSEAIATVPADADPFRASAEQAEFRNVLRKFLEVKSPEAAVRRTMETTDGYEPDVWKQMADQLGLLGLIIPEAYGGVGSSYRDLVVVFEEMGRALLCAPYFSTVALATNLLLARGDETACKDYLPGIARGTTVATVALVEAGGRWDEAGVALDAAQHNGEWMLTGEKLYVTDGHTADLLLVVGRTVAGVSVFAVEKGAQGLSTEAVTTMDLTRKLARVTFASTPARLVGGDGGGWPAVEDMLDRAAVALAGEQIGGAARALEMAVDYASHRIAFGRKIGSYQAIKHKCANMLLEVESAKSAVYYAGWAAAEMVDELPIAARIAKAYCSEAYLHVAAENIQIHGGMGFTWEHPAHLYFKRAKTSQLFLGDPTYHRDLLAMHLGI